MMIVMIFRLGSSSTYLEPKLWVDDQSILVVTWFFMCSAHCAQICTNIHLLHKWLTSETGFAQNAANLQQLNRFQATLTVYADFVLLKLPQLKKVILLNFHSCCSIPSLYLSGIFVTNLGQCHLKSSFILRTFM